MKLLLDLLFPLTPIERQEMRRWDELLARCPAESRAAVIAARDRAFRVTGWATGGRYTRASVYVWPLVALVILLWLLGAF